MVVKACTSLEKKWDDNSDKFFGRLLEELN